MTPGSATRSAVERARTELHAEQAAVVAAERRLAALPRTKRGELRFAAIAVGVSTFVCIAFALQAARTRSATPTASPPPPAELVARRDRARTELDAERARPGAPASPAEAQPEPIPAGSYRALESLRDRLANDQEGILAWTQIGWAACTAHEEPLARLAWAKLDFEAMRSRRASSQGKMHPGISTALRTLDDRCQERGIHLAVPIPR